MANALTWADMLVMPYRHIDQSGVLFQALKFGVPVVATRVGEFASIITPEIGELCDPGEAGTLAEAISQLADRIDKISRERITAMASKYDWGCTVRVLGPCYA